MSSKEHAIEIVNIFEELLDRHEIYIPDEEREGSDNEACIFGTTYGDLVEEVKEYVDDYILDAEPPIYGGIVYALVVRWSSEDSRMPAGANVLAVSEDEYEIFKLFDKHRTKELDEALEANWVIAADDDDYFHAYHEDMPTREFISLHIEEVKVI